MPVREVLGLDGVSLRFAFLIDMFADIYYLKYLTQHVRHSQ